MHSTPVVEVVYVALGTALASLLTAIAAYVRAMVVTVEAKRNTKDIDRVVNGGPITGKGSDTHGKS